MKQSKTLALLFAALVLALSLNARGSLNEKELNSPTEMGESKHLVRGIVLDKHNAPIAGATVTVDNGASMTSDEKGLFSVELPVNGSFTFEAAKKGYTLTEAKTISVSKEFYEVVSIVMESN